jgi:hypothetical protein
MVPLRSKYPNTGRVTLRNTVPRFDMDLALRDGSFDRMLDKTTTPQVVVAEEALDETAARKGGEAR